MPLLVGRQVKEGDGRGSWDPVGQDADVGGRVYSTALSVLCLEVYYRYLPLYLVQGAPAVSVLRSHLAARDGHTDRATLTRLLSIGPSAAPALIDVLPECDESAQSRIVQFLATLPLDAEVCQALSRCLDCPNDLTRLKAATTLAGIGHPGAVRTLIELIHHPNTFVRSEAVDALAGSERPEALRGLIEALGDAEPFVATKALTALKRHTDGDTFDLQPSRSAAERKPAVDRWRRWLSERGAGQGGRKP